jgi:hypothetical protein
MRRALVALTVIGFLGLAGLAAIFAAGLASREKTAVRETRPVWTEVRWPFAIDQWGRGKAFACDASDCGTAVTLYLRAKIGFCNCTTGVADDRELERVSDLDLVGRAHAAVGPGSAIAVAWMKGRSRAYEVSTWPGSTAAVRTIAFNDRCDVIVATSVISGRESAAIEPAILEFLNSSAVLRWAEVTLGL